MNINSIHDQVAYIQKLVANRRATVLSEIDGGYAENCIDELTDRNELAMLDELLDQLTNSNRFFAGVQAVRHARAALFSHAKTDSICSKAVDALDAAFPMLAHDENDEPADTEVSVDHEIFTEG